MITRRLSALFKISLYYLGMLGLFIPTPTCCTASQEGPFLLTSGILKLSDGRIGLGLDGQKIRALKQLYKKIEEMLHGSKKTNGKKIGLYTYNGTAGLTIEDLTQIETTIDKEYMTELLATLEVVKQDFDVKVEAFMESAKGFKTVIFMLIQESCRLRGRHTSFLLTWGKVKEESDRQLFHDKIRTFHDLQEFFEDMLNFFSDLLHSCPKGRAQYEEMLRLYKEQKQQNTLKK